MKFFEKDEYFRTKSRYLAFQFQKLNNHDVSKISMLFSEYKIFENGSLTVGVFENFFQL